MRKSSGKALVIAALAAVGLLQPTSSYAESRGYGGHHHPSDRGGHDGHDKHSDRGSKDHGRDYDGHHGKDHGRDYGGHHGKDYGRDYGHHYKDYGRDYGHHHGPGCGHGHYSRPPVYYGGHRHYYAPPAYYPPPYYRPPYAHHSAGYYCGHCRYSAATVEVFHYHIVHEHRHLVWNDVLAGLTWYPQPGLYVFGQFDF